jgi:hypothetical protein
MITEHKSYSIRIVRTYPASRKKIRGLFKDNTILKFTGADKIEGEFKTGSEFKLSFKGRGKIIGRRIHILKDRIGLAWDVKGFNLPEENSLVEIYLEKKGKKCVLILLHYDILKEESAMLKDKAWTEILNDLDKELKRV